jgi:hypothetical protein
MKDSRDHKAQETESADTLQGKIRVFHGDVLRSTAFFNQKPDMLEQASEVTGVTDASTRDMA